MCTHHCACLYIVNPLWYVCTSLYMFVHCVCLYIVHPLLYTYHNECTLCKHTQWCVHTSQWMYNIQTYTMMCTQIVMCVHIIVYVCILYIYCDVCTHHCVCLYIVHPLWLQIITIFYFKSDNAKFYFGHFDWRNRKKKILRK
jgi:hypothetical protein